MGSTGSTTSSRSKETKETREKQDTTRKEAIAHQVKRIEEIKGSVFNDINTTDVVKREESETMYHLMNTAQHQLQRNDKPFTKADLVAIALKIYVLRGEVKSITEIKQKTESLNSHTIPNLYALVRCLIYDSGGGGGGVKKLEGGSDEKVQLIL